jgi:hypothetical protein
MEEHQLAGHAWYTAVEAAGLAGLVPLLHFDAHSDLSTPFGGSAEVGLGNLAYRNLWATRNDAFIIRVEAFVRGFVSELIWVGLGLGRIVALYCRSSTSCHIREQIRCLCNDDATEP